MTDWIPLCDGVRRKTLASGAAMMQMIVRFDAGGSLAAHAHFHTQLLHVVSGRLHLVVDGVTHELSPGASFLIPPDADHAASAPVETVVLDTFSPPRADLLALDAEHQNSLSERK